LSDELYPFVEGVFLITDVSQKAINLKEVKEKYGTRKLYLVGNRCIDEDFLYELSDFWDIEIFACLKDCNSVRKAEVRQELPNLAVIEKTLRKKGIC